MNQNKSQINGTESIGHIIQTYPQLVPIMQSFGLQCATCSATWETLEQGAKGHGFDDALVQKLIDTCNDFLQNKYDKVFLTPNAVKKLKDLMQSSGKFNHGLRVEILPGGCSGFTYDLSVEPAAKAGDITYDQDDVKLFVAGKSHDILKGSVIDYVDALQGAGFKVINPNSNKECGCGKSFS